MPIIYSIIDNKMITKVTDMTTAHAKWFIQKQSEVSFFPDEFKMLHLLVQTYIDPNHIATGCSSCGTSPDRIAKDKFIKYYRANKLTIDAISRGEHICSDKTECEVCTPTEKAKEIIVEEEQVVDEKPKKKSTYKPKNK